MGSTRKAIRPPSKGTGVRPWGRAPAWDSPDAMSVRKAQHSATQHSPAAQHTTTKHGMVHIAMLSNLAMISILSQAFSMCVNTSSICLLKIVQLNAVLTHMLKCL